MLAAVQLSAFILSEYIDRDTDMEQSTCWRGTHGNCPTSAGALPSCTVPLLVAMHHIAHTPHQSPSITRILPPQCLPNSHLQP